ncbi:MAG TPA: right-handed parallel beta-helix repeat-containing protein [Verrucomicrobiae bacterium]|nr:right-handed parallel beta-helix repeat-containing protein [Verrucomicrobiae bacterium]
MRTVRLPTAWGVGVALACWLSSCCAAPGPQLYVAPNGNDQWTGLLPAPNSSQTDGPFATLDRARDELRTRRASTALTNGATVFIRGGVYRLANVFDLDPVDGGLTNAPIVYQAFSNEVPILTGAHELTGFSTWTGAVLRAEMGAQGLSNIYFRQLFFNSVRQPLARFPNYVDSDPLHSGWSYVDGTTTNMYADLANDSLNQFRFKPGDIHTWSRPQEAEVFIFPRYNYLSDLLPISSLDMQTRTVTLGTNADAAIRPGDRYYVRNVFEELDAPGEWYLDKETWALYFWPPCSMSNAVVSVPTIPTALRISSANIVIRGLTIECVEDMAVGLNGATNCLVTGCTVRDSGGWGVAVFGYENRITGNDIYLVGSDGIYVDGGIQLSLAPGSNQVDNNFVHDTGVFQKGSSGISLAGVGNRASHNLIENCPRMGILFAGNLNVVELNEIHHVGLETDDNAGIFTSGGDWISSRGNIIRNNRVYDCQGFGFDSGQYRAPYYSFGIFLDSDAAAVDVVGNLIAGCSRSALILNNGRDNRISNNILLDCAQEQVTYTGWQSTNSDWQYFLPRMIAGYDSVSNQPAWKFLRGMSISPTDAVFPDGLIMASNEFTHNIIAYTNSTADLYAFSLVPLYANNWDSNIVYHYGQDLGVKANGLETQFSPWQLMGMDSHSSASDPLFVNSSLGDFRLATNSPALAMGFAPLAFEQIGVYASPDRASWPVLPQPGLPQPDLVIIGTSIQVRIQSVVNRSYQLQRADSVFGSTWSAVGPSQAGTGQVLSFLDPSGATGAARYYRFESCP